MPFQLDQSGSSLRSLTAESPPRSQLARRGRWSPRREVHLALSLFPSHDVRAARREGTGCVVNQIQRGQTASASLSKAGGTAPDTELTPEVLANMSDEQFEVLFNELQNSNNKEKLKQIFGH